MALEKCCWCYELLFGVRALGMVLSVLTCISALITAISIAITGVGSYYGLFAYGPILLGNLLLVKACNDRKRVLLLPWLVIMMLSFVVLLVVIAFWLAISEQKHMRAHSMGFSGIAFITGAFTIVLLGLFVNFWTTVAILYREMGRFANPYVENSWSLPMKDYSGSKSSVIKIIFNNNNKSTSKTNSANNNINIV